MVLKRDLVNFLAALFFLPLVIFIFLWFFEPDGVFYNTGLPQMILTGIIALGALMGYMKMFGVGTFFSQTMPRRIQRFARRVGNNDTDTSRERIQFPPTNQAAPLTEVERRRDDTQFRPYEVLYHMQHEARQNLFNDALTQTIELWKNRRGEQYHLLNNNGVDTNNFNANIKTDDNGSFRVDIVMSITESPEEEIIELAKQFRHDFDTRIILLAQLHDSCPPDD